MLSDVFVRVPDVATSYSYQCGRKTCSYSDANVKNSNIKLIQNINKQYSNQINTWSQVFKIPSGVIIGFIATESGGRMLPPNQYNATGLMQVTPGGIYESARKWNVEVPNVPLPSAASNLLVSKVPNFFKTNSVNNVFSALLKNLQNDANFNIMSGTLILRWLLERFTDESGVSKSLNKAMVGYNAGAYRQVLGANKLQRETPIDTTSLATNRLVPLESRSYLLKMLGRDGFLQLIYKDKAI